MFCEGHAHIHIWQTLYAKAVDGRKLSMAFTLSSAFLTVASKPVPLPHCFCL